MISWFALAVRGVVSAYSEGVLRGAIITLNRKKGVRGYQLVAG